jgi:hypothetical protein
MQHLEKVHVEQVAHAFSPGIFEMHAQFHFYYQELQGEEKNESKPRTQ